MSKTNNSPFSVLPLWFLTTIILIIMMGILMIIISLVPEEINSVQHVKLYLISGIMIIEIFFTVSLLHYMISIRIQKLSQILTEDILVVAGDPASFDSLAQLPPIGITEINQLQIAIEQLYFGFSAELQRQGVIPHISYGDGVTKGEKREIGQWHNKNNYNYNNILSEDYEEPSSTNYSLDAYLLSKRYRYKKKLSSVLQIPAETGSRASYFVKGLFTHTPVSNSVNIKSHAIPITRSSTEGDFHSLYSSPGNAALDSSGFQSFPIRQMSNWSDNHEHILITGGDDELGQKGEDSGRSTNNSSISINNKKNNELNNLVQLSIEEMEDCDPLDDNNNNSFELLAKSLRLEGAIIFQIIKSIKVGSSLSSITLPVHILESRSLLEIFSDMFISWDLLLPIALGEVKDPVECMRVMLRWFLAAYNWRPKGVAKKPYNPILGEVFQCKCPAPLPREKNLKETETNELPQNFSSSSTKDSKYNNNNLNNFGILRFIAEQVSHRPPVSVFYAELPNLIIAEGVFLPRSKLVSLNCAASISCSSVIVRFPHTGFSYTFTLPSVYASGVVAGTPRLELGGVVKLQDENSSVYANIEFLRKGFFGGQFDEIVAIITSEDGKSKEEYTGLWHGTISPRVNDNNNNNNNKNNNNNNNNNKKKGSSTVISSNISPPSPLLEEPLFNAEIFQLDRGMPCVRPYVFPINGGHPKQSRKIWKDVTAAIRLEDAEAAAKAKTNVEETQRAERREMAANGREHIPQFFQFVGNGVIGPGNEEELAQQKNWRFIGRETLFK